jgi:hypothetical protein
MAVPTIIEAMDHPDLFRPAFRDPGSWRNWRILLKAAFGLGIDQSEQGVFHDCTGRDSAPSERCSEIWLICGRRAGKSRIMATVAVYLATFIDWTPYLAPGERAVIPIIATDKTQAKIILRYVSALIGMVPAIAALADREISEVIDLSNFVSIEITTASFRTSRGRTIVAVLGDEIAFWPNEDSANPDEEIIKAVRPGMATIPGAMLWVASSPYARRGALWKAFKRYWAAAGRVLVWKASTQTMNPQIPQAWLAEQYEDDPASAAAEYGAEFRTDIETFLSRETIEAVTVTGRHELPPFGGYRYTAFVDAAGGSGGDSMALAIAHGDRRDRIILDALRENKPPFSPDAVVEEYAALLRLYGISKVKGDRYAGDWPAERFQVHGITYEPAELTKSQIYQATLPILNSGAVELLDHPKLMTQLSGLERRTARGGRDSIDHAPGSHDDVANAACGAVTSAVKPKAITFETFGVPSQANPYGFQGRDAEARHRAMLRG